MSFLPNNDEVHLKQAGRTMPVIRRQPPAPGRGAWAQRFNHNVRARLTGALLTLLAVGFCAAHADATGTVGPGGVAGSTLWFLAGDYTGSTWTDRSSAVTASAPSGAATPTALAQDANFNAGVSFDGSTQWLRGTLGASAFASANSTLFVVSDSSIALPSASTFGDVLSGYQSSGGPAQGISFSNGAYGVDTSTSQGQGSFTVTAGTSVLSDATYPNAGSATGATLAQNGISTSVSPAGAVAATTQFDLGGRTSGGAVTNLFAGTIDEIVYFKNTVLTAAKISQIRSYLAIKYGITLGYNAQTQTATPTDYVNSSDTAIWSSSTNSAYHHNVFGIGRDDASGLNQLESNSSTLAQTGNSFSLTVESSTSAGLPAAFSGIQQFLMLGDNGLTTTMANYSGIYRMGRVWLGQSTLASNSYLYFQMPASAFAGVSNPAIWVWSGSLSSTPIYQHAMTCTASICYVVTPAGPGSYYFSFGQLQISGTVFEDPNYGGGSGRPQSTSGCGCTGLSGVRLELYQGGAYASSTTTASDGSYLFLVNPSTSYVVRTVTPTTSSRTGGSTAGIVAVQTYTTTASSGSAVAVTNYVGGQTPGLSDAAANTSSATLASLTTATTTAESITTAAVPAAAGILGLNVGFNFDTIVNANGSGQGSLRQFLVNANALGGVSSLAQYGQTAATQTSIFMIGNGSAHNGLHAGTNLLPTGAAAIPVTSALPAITGAGTFIDGLTQTANDSNTNTGAWGTGGTVGTDALTLSTVSKPTVGLVGSTSAAPGLSVTASNVTIRGIAISGFGTGGGTNSGDIVVSGSSTTGTLIENNVIGTSATAFSAAGGSGGNGIVASGSAGGTIQNNAIGYTSGLPVVLSATSGWALSGNEIRAAQGNASYAGVTLASTTGSTLSGNLIAANPAAGITMSGTTGSLTIQDNTISGNGVSVSGTAPLQTPGIMVSGSASTVSKNIVSANYGAGVLVVNGSTQNTLSQNSIYSNGTIAATNGAAASGEIGIDLAGAADAAGTGSAPFITPNRSGGTGTGGNNFFNFPVLDGASLVGGNLTLSGYARAGAAIEFFIADTAPSSGFGQGKTYVMTATEGATAGTVDSDATTATYTNPGNNSNIGTDTASRFRFTVAAPGGVSVGSVITAAEYLAADGTSEFGPNIVVGSAALVPAIATVLSVSPNGATQIPGTALTYTGVFTNGGGAQAYTFAIVDPIPANTDFALGSAVATVTNTNLGYTVQYSNDAALATWTYVPQSTTGGAPSGYDGTVTGVRFAFSGALGFSTPYNSGSFSLTVRIR